ncbi:MAG TPA: hypothetical protein VJV39_01035 [Dongiaceae bacterium]|nr:hypothetical protein [Dongiaceae bacterium]
MKVSEEAIDEDAELAGRGDRFSPDVGSKGKAEVSRRTTRLEIAGNRAAEIEDSALPAAFDVAA